MKDEKKILVKNGKKRVINCYIIFLKPVIIGFQISSTSIRVLGVVFCVFSGSFILLSDRILWYKFEIGANSKLYILNENALSVSYEFLLFPVLYVKILNPPKNLKIKRNFTIY